MTVADGSSTSSSSSWHRASSTWPWSPCRCPGTRSGGPALRRGPGPGGAAGASPAPRNRPPPERLADLELLLPAPGTALRDEIDAASGPAGVMLRPAMELDGLRLIASLTFDGYGPAILPATAVPGHLRPRF